MLRSAFALLGLALLFPRAIAAVSPLPQSFTQEIAHHRSRTNGLGTGAIQLLEVGADGTPRVFAAGHWSRWRGDHWEPMAEIPASGPGEFVFPGADGRPLRAPLPAAEVIQLLRQGPTNYLLTVRDPHLLQEGRLQTLNWPSRFAVRQGAISPAGELWIASTAGLHRRGTEGWIPVRAADGVGRVWAAEDALGVAFDSKGRPWVASRAGVGFEDAGRWTFFEGRDGLPWNDFTSVAAGPGNTTAHAAAVG